MKKKLISLTCTAVSLAMLWLTQACKLEVTPLDRYTDVTVWGNENNARLYLLDQYALLRTFAFGQFPVGYSNATDGLTDLVKFTSTLSGNGTVNMIAFNPSSITAANPTFSYWAEGYQRIFAINNFLAGTEKYKTFSDSTAKKSYEAEARFLRAYVYHWLVRLHGSVILLEKPVSTNNNPRASEDECWNFIARDLAFAAQYLPETRGTADVGRATKGAAYALLARTWLYAASVAEYDRKQYNADPLTGVPVSKKETYYKNATAAAEAVMALETKGIYQLLPRYSDVFYTKNNREMLLTFNFIRPTLTHAMDRDYAPPGDTPAYGSMGVPTAELADAFEMADGKAFSWTNAAMAAAPFRGREPRFYATILFNGSVWKGRTLNTATGNEGYVDYGSQSEPKKTVTGYYIRKYIDSTNTDALRNASDLQSTDIRYAEVLLIYAEAQAKNGQFAAARDAINKVRKRAGLPGVTANDEAGLMAAVEHERIVELAFEGHRFWDLRRWRKAHVVLNNMRVHGHRPVADGKGGFTYELVDADKQNRYFAPITYYIPLPSTEIVNNPSLTQIQGW
ncbi:RagB/SusD family nutrient uptake outer membrane protein [Siphonobacter aquaeclarae]|uniref:Starch-binding associating with outer membrane n=1 Tax=Siphonobacter aquaeclarae TaxID=563176 RepID=A0A1G9ICN2_9BACT|nr:RagB/SusD family nutrient uptake outer membrane protein [Siphonobacter aquaeclarae]SDL22967.1 Starch-binding associating with outer membrane [Siphonobacter aquaeclarae]